MMVYEVPAENPSAAERNVLLANVTSLLKYTMHPPKAVARPAKSDSEIAITL